jgi:serine/threonine protein kinase/Tol biopolymer transport system component
MESALGATSTGAAPIARPLLPNWNAALPDFGPYHAIGVLGEGGMGIVYLAEQREPIRRRVALKVLKRGDDRPSFIARFESERQALAVMDHPHIAHVYDAGATADGRPYFVMEYVPGIPITDYCDRNLLGFRERLALFQQVCQAVQHAHQRGIIHRDLKPSNVLVTLLDGKPVPKVIDFGVAKAVNQRLTEKTLFTETGMLIGTPEYMSPEQADLTGLDVDATTDVYSLGVLLYELLVGALPFDAKELRRAGYAEIQRVIREQEPPRPTTRLSGLGQTATEIARRRKSDVRTLIRLLRGDLEWITMKALEKDRTRRYASASDFAADIGRHLASEPVSAGPPTFAYRFQKAVRRNRGKIAAGAAVLAALAFGLIPSVLRVPAPKELKPERLTANTPELTIQAAAISPDGKSIAYSDPLGIHIRSVASGATRLLPGTQDHMLVQWMPDGNSVQTQVHNAAGGETAMVVSLQGGTPTPLSSDPFVASPDGTHRATVAADHRQLSIQDANGGNLRELWRAAARSTLEQFKWSPNGKQIAVLSSKDNGQGGQGASTLELIEIGGGQKNVLVSEEKDLSMYSMVWPSQNRMIVTIDEDLGTNQYDSNLWELRLNDGGALIAGGLRKLTSWTDLPIRSGSLSTDGKRLVFIRSFRQRDVYVASLEAGGTRMGTPRRLTLDLGDDYPTDWTRDSKTVILTSSRNGPPAIFRQDLDKQTAEQIVVMPQKPDSQLVARVTPDGHSVLFRNWDPVKKIAQLMRVPIGGGTPEAVPNAANVGYNYRCAPAGVCVIAQTEGQGFIISEFDPVKGKGREIYRDRHVEHLWLSSDGKLISTTSGNGSEAKIVLRSFSTGAVVQEVPVRGVTMMTGFDFAPDGKGFFVGDRSLTEARELYIDLAGNSSILWRQPGIDSWIWGTPSPDGKYLALMMFTDDSNVYMIDKF